DGDIYLLGGLQFLSVNPFLSSSDYSGEKEGTVNMKFFQVPVMCGFQIVKSPDSKRCLHVQGGGSFSTLLDVGENDLGVKQENLKKTGFTVKAGVGADLG